jgi:hypothetical protein
MSKQRIVMAVSIAALMVALANQAEAGWGRYRVSTYYGTPTVPVVRETVVVRRPVIWTPAPVVVSPVPVTAYYAAPAVYFPAPRGAVRTTYFAPVPGTYYQAPAPTTYFYQGHTPGTIILP